MDSSIIFSGPVAEADMIKLYLEGNGLSAWLDDESLGTCAPHIASAGGVMAVKVRVSSDDASRAIELLKKMHKEDDRAHQPSWICPQCLENVEGQFTQCWNCNAVRDKDEL